MGHIKGLIVLLALFVAVNGKIYVNDGPIETGRSSIEAAQTDTKTPASDDPPNWQKIELAEEKPAKQTDPSIIQPVWEQGAVMAEPPTEETPESIPVPAEEPVPAPAPSLLEEQIVTLPAEIEAVVPMDPIEAPPPKPIDDVDPPSEAPPPEVPLPDDPPPKPAVVTDTPSEGPVVAPILSVTPKPIVDKDPSSESPPAQAPLPNEPQQPPAVVTNATYIEPEVPPGLDMILSKFKKRGASDPWPIPDWSWAGYAGDGKYKTPSSKKQINVMDFGAKRDGKTDDAPAIQAAIDLAGSEGGGTVYLPAGRYLIKNQLTISESNVVLKGAGKSLTVLYSSRPLSEVVKDGRDHINSVGQSRFSWQDGFVRITGRSSYSSKKTLLGKVIYHKSRGWTALLVDTPENFKPGMWVRLYMSDSSKLPNKKSLASALYSHRIQKSKCGTKCLRGLRGKKDLIRWAVRVERIKGNKVIFERPLPMDVNPRWKPELHELPEWRTPRNCGIEGIRVEFALERMAPHLKEAGFNGIAIENALNAWVKDVSVVNSDNAMLVRFSSHVTIDNIEIYARRDRTRSPRFKTQGHIGIGLYESSDVEVTKFNLKSKMLHDTTVRGTILCVFHNGRGIDLNLDSHRGAPFGTLYSNIDVGKGTRVFTSGGGGGNGFPAASYTTYWNLKAGSEKGKLIEIPSKTSLGQCTYGVKLAFQGKFTGKRCKTYFVNKKKPTPTDLFASQVYKRLSGMKP